MVPHWRLFGIRGSRTRLPALSGCSAFTGFFFYCFVFVVMGAISFQLEDVSHLEVGG